MVLTKYINCHIIHHHPSGIFYLAGPELLVGSGFLYNE